MSELTAQQSFHRALGQLQAGNPAAAAQCCRAALTGQPDDVDLLTLHGAALLSCRQPQEALRPLEHAVARAPGFARAREYLGQVLTVLGRLDEAVEHLQHAVRMDPQSESARLKLAHALAVSGRGEDADAVYEEAFDLRPVRRELAIAAEHLRAGRIEECADICRKQLEASPDDVDALRLLAKVAGEKERWGRAEFLLARVLELAPGHLDARLDLARVYKQQDRVGEAVACTLDSIRRSPGNAFAHYMHASMLAVAGRHEEALEAYREAVELRPFHPAAWTGMGHLLKTLGRQAEGIAAYRKAIEQRPNFGEVYWSLANLKTFRFSDEELADMQRRLGEEPLDEESRVHFLFAVGKALEDRAQWAEAFDHYAQACELRRADVFYDPVHTRVINQRIRDVFTADFLAQRQGDWGHDPVPIFIVGLPRSGSTLIEQILASHSQVEGTAELPDVGRVIGQLNAESPRESYPEAVRSLSQGGLRQLGRSYLERTQRHRAGLPWFTDKMPNNFPSIGLIHLMLPKSIIIDARRHPLDSCFGSFKQHFAHGQTWTYDLLEVGQYFLEYRAMMRHWRRVLPGRVLEVRYEDVVRDLEGQSRRLLDHCGLPFEERCLRFWETQRAVRTASSEQVRQPIYETSLDHWRHYGAQLEPLAEILADEIRDWEG